MKKFIKIVIIALSLCTVLAGCKDATATVSNPNELVIQIGKEKITKKDLYDRMVKDDAANTIITKAMEIIANAEIEDSDEITKAAQELFDSYKEQLESQGDFEEVLKNLGYDSVDDFMKFCVTRSKSNKLVEKYIDEKWDDIFREYLPLKARMIFIDASDIGNEAAREKANEAITTINNSLAAGKVSQAGYNAAVGKAKFLRALAYLKLTQLWGEVPVFTEEGGSTTERQDFDVVFGQIIKDFTDLHLLADLRESYEKKEVPIVAMSVWSWWHSF